MIEPFFGGGSVSFGLSAVAAVGADTNGELVNFYSQSATNATNVFRTMSNFKDDRDTYNKIRSWVPTTDIERAARFAYLNRTSYFGLYRTNQRGVYNVPYGGGGRLNLETFERGLLALAEVLRRVSVEHLDYLALLARVEPSDVVFLDPPYGAKGDFPFRRYGSLLFTSADHRRLSVEAERCRSLGATVILTLPHDDSLLSAYAGWAVLGERRRGGRVVEVCIGPEPMPVASTLSSRDWKQATRVLPRMHDKLRPTGT